MTTKFNLSQICSRAWQNARSIARGNNAAARVHLADGFRNAWRAVKAEMASREIAAKVVVLPREAYATRAQIAYIESLTKRSAPASLTKAAASTMIDRLISDRDTAQDRRVTIVEADAAFRF